MPKYEIDTKVLPVGLSGHIDRELGRCKPGEVIECTKEQAEARVWLKPLAEKKSEGSPKKKKASKTKAAEKTEAANAKE